VIVSNAKMGGHGYRPENWHFLFVMGPAGKAPLQTDWALSTGHTGADAIEVVFADGPTHILHTGMGSRGLGRAKSRTGLPM